MPMYPSPKATGETRHMVATKSFLYKAVQAYGAQSVLMEWEGTDTDALEAIMADSREVIALNCDHYDESGYCLGHERT